MGFLMDWYKTRELLVNQPLGTIAFVSGQVYVKTLSRSYFGNKDGHGDRWLDPKALMYYNGAEFTETVLVYPEGSLVLM